MGLLDVVDIKRDFNGVFALDSVDLSLEAGNLLCLLGPSGCGKTTLLRIIAGLEKTDTGTVKFDGRDLSRIPPHRRGFGMMFQDFSLFPHKNVYENVAFALQLKKESPKQIRRRVVEMLDLVGLEGFELRDVNRLSGGECQRVALARSLASEPRLLMLDEPLGSLDRVLRERLLVDLYRIIKQIGVTTLYVTHDHAEAFTVADVVAETRGKIRAPGDSRRRRRRCRQRRAAAGAGYPRRGRRDRCSWSGPRGGRRPGSRCSRSVCDPGIVRHACPQRAHGAGAYPSAVCIRRRNRCP